MNTDPSIRQEFSHDAGTRLIGCRLHRRRVHRLGAPHCRAVHPTEDLPGRKAGTDHGTVVAKRPHPREFRKGARRAECQRGTRAEFRHGSPERAAPGGAEADGWSRDGH